MQLKNGPFTSVNTCPKCQRGEPNVCPKDPLTDQRPFETKREQNQVVLHKPPRGFKVDAAPDFYAAESAWNLARRATEGHQNMAGFVKSLLEVFHNAGICDIYVGVDSPSDGLTARPLIPNLRITNIPEIKGMRAPVLHDMADPYLTLLMNASFLRGKPIYVDELERLRLIFSSLDKADNGCDVFPATREDMQRTGSLAVMPYFQNERASPAGVVVLRGDLRCRGSKLEGFASAFWSAKAAMAMAVQIAMQGYRYDRITDLKRKADYEIDMRNAASALLKGELKSLHLLLFDLDHFKDINTKHGYLKGDRVLASIAESLRQTLGGDENLYRWGGEEFVVIVKDSGCLDVLNLAEKLRMSVKAKRHDGLEVTCSFGVSQVDPAASNGHGADPVALAGHAFHDANTALASAKNEGKDRGCIKIDGTMYVLDPSAPAPPAGASVVQIPGPDHAV